MAASLNSIGYALYENRLKSQGSDTKTYYARILPRGRVDEDTLAEMITQRNSTVTRQEVPAALSAGDWTVEVRCGFSSIIRSARLALPVTAA